MARVFPARRSLTLALVASAGLAAPVPGAHADETVAPLTPEVLRLPPPGALLTDGDVQDIVDDGSRAFLTGSFDHVGRYSGPTVLLDGASGAASPVSARLNGQVSRSVPDGAGGFFVAGGFSLAGDARHANVVHLKPDGTVDAAFTAATDGPVYALALDGDRLYLGGDFTRVGGVPHERVAVVDAARGLPLPFQGSSSSRVTELALAPAAGAAPARLYVGALAGPLQGLDAATGAALPGFDAGPVTGVRALTAGGGRVYVGGAGVTALDGATGRPAAGFAPRPTGGGTVQALLLDGDRLLAGGDFGGAYGAGVSLVALDPRTGATDPAFRPRIGPDQLRADVAYSGPGRPDTELDSGVFDLARIGGDLWVGGRFTSVGTTRTQDLAVLDAATGALRPRALPYLGGQVNALAVAPSGRLLVGGNFAMAGARAVSSIVAVDPRTLAPDGRFGAAGAPPVQDRLLVGSRYLVDTDPDGENYGASVPRFTSRTTAVRVRSAVTGAPVRPGVGAVRDMTGAAMAGDRVLIARRLENRPGFPRTVLELRDPASGRVVRRLPVPLRGYIEALLPVGDDVYVAGSFRRRRANGQQANLAVIRMSLRTGRMDELFDPHVHGPVYALGLGPVARGATGLGLVGSFDKVTGFGYRGTIHARRTRGGAVTVDPVDGAAWRDRTPANPLGSPFPSLFPAGYGSLAGPGFSYPRTSAAVAGRRLVLRSLGDVQTGGELRGRLEFVVSAPR